MHKCSFLDLCLPKITVKKFVQETTDFQSVKIIYTIHLLVFSTAKTSREPPNMTIKISFVFESSSWVINVYVRLQHTTSQFFSFVSVEISTFITFHYPAISGTFIALCAIGFSETFPLELSAKIFLHSILLVRWLTNTLHSHLRVIVLLNCSPNLETSHCLVFMILPFCVWILAVVVYGDPTYLGLGLWVLVGLTPSARGLFAPSVIGYLDNSGLSPSGLLLELSSEL